MQFNFRLAEIDSKIKRFAFSIYAMQLFDYMVVDVLIVLVSRMNKWLNCVDFIVPSWKRMNLFDIKQHLNVTIGIELTDFKLNQNR